MRNNKVLLYHSIGRHPAGEKGAELYCVTVENFRAQMLYMSQVKDIIITFDDGDITNYKEAFPVLKQMNIKAYFFVLAGRIGTPAYMNWQQVRELRGAGMTIGSHGMNHSFLTGLSDKELDYEIISSKSILEKELGEVVEYFSVPRGFYNRRVLKKIKEAGYKAVFTSNIVEKDGFRIGRITVRSDWNIGYFKKVLKSKYILKEKAVELTRESLRAALGSRNYNRLRDILLKESKE